jgi:LytR cell envelope-related transcriptional attenuator
MAVTQSFTKRVLIPLGAIALTVSGLTVMGLSLWNLQSVPSASVGTSASDTADNSLLGTNGYLPVNVFNGSQVPGLARTTADTLQRQNWTINTIGNWSGATIDQSTVFYPAGNKASAVALAALLQVQVKPAENSMSQSELTYIVAR